MDGTKLRREKSSGEKVEKSKNKIRRLEIDCCLGTKLLEKFS